MLKPTVLTIAILVPIGIAASYPVLAQGGQGGFGGGAAFEMLDTDGDGSLSLEELQQPEGGLIARADTDGDGAVSRDELIAAGTERVVAGADRMMAALDGDGDGLVTEVEIAEAREARQQERRDGFAERIFERIDADGDGAISADEFAAAQERMGERRGGLFGPRG